MYYPCSENKGADQLRGYAVTAKLICVFVFAYADCWFSHKAAQLLARTGHNESQSNPHFAEMLKPITKPLIYIYKNPDYF